MELTQFSDLEAKWARTEPNTKLRMENYKF